MRVGSGAGGVWQKKLTLSGLLVAAWTVARSVRACSTLSCAQARAPRPPAALTAIAISGVLTPAIGAWRMGRSMPNRSRMRRSCQLFITDLLVRLTLGRILLAPRLDRQSADAPVFLVDLADHDEGPIHRLVQHLEQQLADPLDQVCLLLRGDAGAVGRGALARHLDVHVRHLALLPVWNHVFEITSGRRAGRHRPAALRR